MKMTLRLIVSIMIAVIMVSGFSSYLSMRSEKERLGSELHHRAWLVTEGMKDSVASFLPQGQSKKLEKLVEKISTSEQVFGVVIYNSTGNAIVVSKLLSEKLPSKLNIIFDKFESDIGKGIYEKISNIPMYIFAASVLNDEGIKMGTIVIFSDVSYIDKYIKNIWLRNFLRVLINVFLISVVILLVIRWNITGPISRMSEWMKSVRKGETGDVMNMPKEDLFAPISKEFSSLAKSLALARAATEEEAKLRQKTGFVWTREGLREHVRSKLKDKRLIVVSNREPYMHNRRGKNIECLTPASGLITALDPLLRACNGVWVAHGAGSADKDMVDGRNIIRVPPENPQYDLKRVWLTTEEEEGYYYGFSNEGIWPLCHIAHARPVFRTSDWARYKDVNFKFARNINDIINGESYIFIQDYHFSILPRIIRERQPQARIALFWHIPWPNPEAFGICPWKREIIHGMLGADVIGFHTQFYCNNFLETVDRTLECQTDWEHFSTTRRGHTTFVKPFPISIDPQPEVFTKELQSKEDLLKNLGVQASIMGVGVDRLDYTKGIPERLRTIERFLEKNPEYVGLFTFVQIGAPSREHIKRYHDLIGEVEMEVDRINWKFQTKGWRPIVFIKRHFSHSEIQPYYKNADVCIVSSLHDGMNLVAKEFVIAKEDEQGTLILSTFAGASRELRDALLINPYDIEQSADMIKVAVEMDSADQKLRMKRMRDTVKENNIYKWAADIITEVTREKKL